MALSEMSAYQQHFLVLGEPKPADVDPTAPGMLSSGRFSGLPVKR
jgi:hypothetical protein